MADAPRALDLDGLAGRPIGPVTISDSRFSRIADPTSRIRNAPGVRWRGVTINGCAP